jgi:hypothetical protein
VILVRLDLRRQDSISPYRQLLLPNDEETMGE